MAKIKLKSLIESLVRKTLEESYSAEQNVSELMDSVGEDREMLELLKDILESPEAISRALISIRTELEDSEDSEDSESMSSRDFGLSRDLDRATGVKSPR
jgi:hypothetical protein